MTSVVESITLGYAVYRHNMLLILSIHTTYIKHFMRFMWAAQVAVNGKKHYRENAGW